MELLHEAKRGLSSTSDFRVQATFGVAIAALCLVFPIAIFHFFRGDTVIGIGCAGIVLMLVINVILVSTGRCHQTLTLYVLVPGSMLFMVSVFNNDGIIGSLWCFPSIVACYCMLSEGRAWVANIMILSVSLPMATSTLSTEYSIRIIATLVAVSVFSAVLVSVIDRLNRQLQFQLKHDPLTGLFNRLTLRDCLLEAIGKHVLKTRPTTLLAIDIDHFKQVNDKYGHDIGDQVLVKLADIIKTKLRADDYAFRTGGEEFLVLLNNTGIKDAHPIAERLRREIENALILPDEQAITISVGGAQYLPDETWADWMKRADNNLYEAKRRGRNRVTLASKSWTIDLEPVEKPAQKQTGRVIAFSY